MKRILLVLLISVCTFFADAQIQMPQPSPTQTTIQNFGTGKIELTYSRPSLKGRPVFEENSPIAPLGTMWRTGANAATKIRFSDKVQFGGKDLDSGTYALYSIPGKDEWTIIVNKGINNSGLDGYKETDDLFRFTIKPHQMNSHAIETFTMEFGDLRNESANLYLLWDKTAVVIPIQTDIKDKIKTQVEQAMLGEKKPYWQAANYYFEYEKDYNKTITYISKALKDNPDAFWMHMLKAKAEKAAGNSSAAKMSAEKTKELAEKAGNSDYVSQAESLLATL